MVGIEIRTPQIRSLNTVKSTMNVPVRLQGITKRRE